MRINGFDIYAEKQAKGLLWDAYNACVEGFAVDARMADQGCMTLLSAIKYLRESRPDACSMFNGGDL